jgi:hypothetical protein
MKALLFVYGAVTGVCLMTAADWALSGDYHHAIRNVLIAALQVALAMRAA